MVYKSSGETIHIVAGDFNPWKTTSQLSFRRRRNHTRERRKYARKRKPMVYKSSGGTIHIVAKDFNPWNEADRQDWDFVCGPSTSLRMTNGDYQTNKFS